LAVGQLNAAVGVVVFVLGLVGIIVSRSLIEQHDQKIAVSQRQEMWNRLSRQFHALIDQHELVLTQQRRQHTRFDVYGNAFAPRWYDEEIPYFIEHVVLPNVDADLTGLIQTEIFRTQAKTYIDRATKGALKSELGFNPLMTGVEYEELCKSILEAGGWQVRGTAVTGDQGVDLLASKDGVNVAIQCKRYDKPVDNSAVQQIVAGRIHYHVPFGVVVSNSGYTQSAQQLAASNAVRLLHHDDLSRGDFYLARPRST